MKEIWKDIPWYEWVYQVSNLGDIKSFKYSKWVILKPYNCKWYLKIDLIKNWKRKSASVHRLVWLIFIPNIKNKETINHKNWIKADNRLENLEWNTKSENMQHAWDNWLKTAKGNHFSSKNNPSKLKKGEKHFNNKKVKQLDLNWNLIKLWDSITEAWKYFWFTHSAISWACRWKRKTSWWYKWEYL